MAESVERALRILVELGEAPGTISDLARRLDVHRSTAMRLLRQLEAERFVRRRDDGRYALGPTIQALSQAALEEYDVRAVAHPHLQALGDRYGHTVHLAGLQDREVVYLDKVDSRHAIRMHSRVGATAPLHATGVGKAILAYLPEARYDQLLGEEPYRACTTHTHTTRRELVHELAAVRERGWVLDDREHEEFIHCVAAPVFDATGQVCAAISVTMPVMLMERDDLIALAPEVTAAAAAIGKALGWRPRDERQMEETP